MTIDELKNLKVAILGFGKEGQATFNYLKKHDVNIAAVLDANEIKEDDTAKLEGVPKIIGANYLDNLNEFDIIFRSPGVPRLHPKLLAFKDQTMVYSQTKLFFDLCSAPIVAVTGTKGKTTTSSLIYEIISASGKKTFLGGNIGEPMLNFVDEANPDSIVVLEVSSFQAQDLHESPHVGVILNVTHDHLDDGTFRAASHQSDEEYLKAKAQLIANQTEDDFAILHPDLGEIFTKSGKGKKLILNPADAAAYKSKLLGNHNRENIGAAILACRSLGIDEESIQKGITNFSGVPQRLQVVTEIGGVTYVNDSASTNPDSTIAAIHSFEKGVILIVGGSEKGLDYSELGHQIASCSQVKAMVAIGQVAQKIISAAAGFQGQILTGAKDMSEIVAQARSLAELGDVVLLSPAAASFDMFLNSKDRGQQFDAEVEKSKGNG